MSATLERVNVTREQYTALLTAVVLPTPAELFEFQVGVLHDTGLDLPEADISRLRELIPDQPQLFLLVPRKPDPLDLKGLMHVVDLNGKRGENYLEPAALSDLIEVPTSAHLLLDVEDGRARLNTKPSVATERIKDEKRIAYGTWYGLVHGIVFPYVLDHHNLDLVGSRYGSDSVPYLYRDDNGVPRLDYYWSDYAYPRWGAPSAGSRVGA